MFAKLRALVLVCGIAAAFSVGCSNDNTSADMNGDAKCCKSDQNCAAKDGKCCGSCTAKKEEAAKK